MKKKRYILLLSAVLTLGISSCSDFLDARPADRIPQEDFWSSAQNVRAFVADVYTYTFPTVYEGAGPFDEGMSDNSYMVWEGWYTNIKLVANGTQTSYSSVPYNIWSRSYKNIRKCFQFLENIDITQKMDEAEKEKLTGQIRFLLAYSYNKLAFFFGDVPLITAVLTVEESKEVPRSPKADIINFIHEQLDLSIKELANHTMIRGEATVNAVKALKARAYLLHNDYENLLKVTSDLKGKHTLYTAGETPYSDLFNGKAEDVDEVIFAIQMMHSAGSINTGHTFNQAFFLKGMSGGDALAALTPTGNMIDSYPMSDGRLIDEQGSTYNPRDPYKDRDPRFYESILYPTSMLLSVVDGNLKEVYYDPEDSRTNSQQVYSAKEPSATGYMWKKYVDWSDHAMIQITDCGNDQIIFRYADVLLMHAEALLETKGLAAKTEVVDIINQLRSRVDGGLVHQANYTDVESLRYLLRNERRVELANEGLRYYDIIRWRIAEDSPMKDRHGLKGTVYGAYMRLDGIGKDDRTVMVDGVPRRYVSNNLFDPGKHYLQPIPQKEIDLANEGVLTQNPKW